MLDCGNSKIYISVKVLTMTVVWSWNVNSPPNLLNIVSSSHKSETSAKGWTKLSLILQLFSRLDLSETFFILSLLRQPALRSTISKTTKDNNSQDFCNVPPISTSALTMMTDPNTRAASIKLNPPSAPPTVTTSVEKIVSISFFVPPTMVTIVEAIAQRPTERGPRRVME